MTHRQPLLLPRNTPPFTETQGQKSSTIVRDVAQFPWALNGTVKGLWERVRGRKMYQMYNSQPITAVANSPSWSWATFQSLSGWAQGGSVALMFCQILSVARFSQKQSETLSVVTQVFESVLQWTESWVDSSTHPERSPDSFPGSTCGADPLPALEATQLPLSEENEKWNNYQVK